VGGIRPITSLSIPVGGSIKNMNWPPTLNENTIPKRVGLNVVWGCDKADCGVASGEKEV